MARPLIEIERNWDSAKKKAVKKLKGRVDKSRIPKKWKKMTNQDMQNHLIFCLLTGQTRVKILARYLNEKVTQKNKGFKGMSEKEIAKVLKEYGIRFHNRKAARVHRVVTTDPQLKDLFQENAHLSQKDLKHDRWARSIFLEEIGEGMGPKQSSLYLKDIGFAINLAVIDSRHFHFAQDCGLLGKEHGPGILQGWKNYDAIEEWEADVAEDLGVPTASIDWAIMDYVEESKKR